MKIKLSREGFDEQLKAYVVEGEKLLSEYKYQLFNSTLAENLQREFKFWNEEVSEFLSKRLYPSEGNIYFTDFNKHNINNIELLFTSIIGDVSNRNINEYKMLLSSIRKKTDVLISLQRKSKFLDVDYGIIDYEFEYSQTIEMKEKQIFISHSTLDSKIVEKLIDIIEAMGTPSNKIFCSSFEGYGVPLGDNFLDTIKRRFDNEVLVLFILSENFYSSPISLCEMGAVWVKSAKHLPILIPPFDYNNIKGVFPSTKGMKINEAEKLNSLKSVIEEFLNLKPIELNIWERKRNNLIKEINSTIKSQLAKKSKL